jgi:hypothetical protein
MVDSAGIREFWSQWGHEPNPTQEFKKFRTCMTEVARQLWNDYFQKKDYEGRRDLFAVISGTPCGPYPYFEQSGLRGLLTEAKNVFEVAHALQYLLWSLEKVSQSGFAHCCRELQAAIEISPTIMIRLALHGSTATLYPSGARLLDEAVVESNLAWLARYPTVLNPFVEALKLYAAKDPKQYRSMLDNLRFAIEQMVRTILNNQKSLENQKDELLRWLKAHDVHAQIRGMYHDLLFGGFAGYQNDAVKHQEDQYTLAEVEFVLYATGTFLRLIQRLIEQGAVVKTPAAVVEAKNR